MKETLPAASVATPAVPPSGAFTAALGVQMGVPPATVEMKYCCPTKTEAPASSKLRVAVGLMAPLLSLNGYL